MWDQVDKVRFFADCGRAAEQALLEHADESPYVVPLSTRYLVPLQERPSHHGRADRMVCLMTITSLVLQKLAGPNGEGDGLFKRVGLTQYLLEQPSSMPESIDEMLAAIRKGGVVRNMVLVCNLRWKL